MAKSISLDFNELYKQSILVKLLVCFVLVIVILGLGWFLSFSSQRDELSSLENKEQTLRNEFSEKAVTAASLPVLKEELKQLEEAFAVLLKQLPTDAEVPNLIQELNQAGSNNSLLMSSTKPNPAQSDGPVEILPYSISTRGSYEQLTKFAKDVGSLSRIVVLSSVNITADGNKDGKLAMTALANTYKVASTLPDDKAKK